MGRQLNTAAHDSQLRGQFERFTTIPSRSLDTYIQLETLTCTAPVQYRKMRKYFLSNLSFQIMSIITIGLFLTAFIQYVFSQRIIQDSILNGTKKQAYTYLLGIERQIQSLKDPLSGEKLTELFRSAFIHDVHNLDFAIINVYMYDRKGSVLAFLHEPETMQKDLDSYYGDVLKSQDLYLGEKIEAHHSDEQGKDIRSMDIIIPVHYEGNVIGGLEVET